MTLPSQRARSRAQARTRHRLLIGEAVVAVIFIAYIVIAILLCVFDYGSF